ncbi:MAG: hypothetical protein WBD36_04665 [Bacteroidota bacterium]
MTSVTGFLVFAAVIAILLVGIIKAIKGPKKSGFASYAAFHDFQPKDKQAGVEAVIEQKAGKKKKAEESGESTP